jgi:hypothetical protein
VKIICYIEKTFFLFIYNVIAEDEDGVLWYLIGQVTINQHDGYRFTA